VKDGILCKAESPKQKEYWTITTVHTNGTIRVTRGNKSEQINVRRVEPYFEKYLKIMLEITNKVLKKI